MMNKKVIILRAVLTALIMSVILSCDSRPRLYIFNWTYYTPDSIIEKFEEEYNVRVVYDEFATNEEMFAKLMASKGGKASYDVVFPSKDYVSIMINEGLLARIDKSKLKNIGNIDPEVMNIADFDPDMEYSVPYYYGAAGILINTEKVPYFDNSWSIFEREDLKGRMTMLDDMREVMGAALSYLGYSVNTTDPAEIAEARDLVNIKWKPNLVKFDSDAYNIGFIEEEFWVVFGFPESIYEDVTQEDVNNNFINNPIIRNTRFIIPEEGGGSYFDSMVILKDARNIDLAHTFIDFIHRPEIYAEFVDAFGLPATVNVPARALKKGHSFYTLEDLQVTELVNDLGDSLELYNDAWFNVIKAGDDDSDVSAIAVIRVLLVIVLITAVIIGIIMWRKKKK